MVDLLTKQLLSHKYLQDPKWLSQVHGGIGTAENATALRLLYYPPLPEDSDIKPYIHVPPDGLPRTVYLLPPLQDLLQEAKKARYVRRPRKPFQVVDKDDPDRELGIDEIFSKKG